MKKPYAQARLYFKLVVSLTACTYWLVRIVVLLLGGSRRNDVINSASVWAMVDCGDVVERHLDRELSVFFVLMGPNVWNLYRC
jgi:hypothetical protein